MKKIILYMLILTTALFTLSACDKKLTTYEELTYNEVMSKLDNKESFALFIGSSECSHCADYKITLEKFIKDKQVKVYYLNIINLSGDEYNHFVSLINFGGTTPTTVFINDGEETTVYNRIVGAQSYSKITSKFKAAGFLD